VGYGGLPLAKLHQAETPSLPLSGVGLDKGGVVEPSVSEKSDESINKADPALDTRELKTITKPLDLLKENELRIASTSQDDLKTLGAEPIEAAVSDLFTGAESSKGNEGEAVMMMSDMPNLAAGTGSNQVEPAVMEVAMAESRLDVNKMTTLNFILPKDLEAVSAEGIDLNSLVSISREVHSRQHHAADQLKLPIEVRTRNLGVVLCLIPAGSFCMGSPLEEVGRDTDERLHDVTLTESFYCGKYKITQEQWQAVMGMNPSHFVRLGPDAPVEQVSWWDCQAFLKKLCQMEGVPGATYRLLTEAQWEYACRAGTDTVFNCDDQLYIDEERIGAVKSGGRSTVCVGQSFQNAFGLYGMHGNVYEWCQDWYGAYPSEGITNPSGPLSGVYKIIRGGSWRSKPEDCRSASRLKLLPIHSWINLGLRIARYLPSNSTDGGKVVSGR